jgi:hypothetical protein
LMNRLATMEHLYGWNQGGIHTILYNIPYCNINRWKRRLKKKRLKKDLSTCCTKVLKQ